MKKGIIFDMDGTLWDSVDEIVYSWNEALRAFPEAAIVLTREKLLGFMGKTMDKFAEGLFPHLPVERGLEILHDCEQKENDYLMWPERFAGCTKKAAASISSATARQDISRRFLTFSIWKTWWMILSVTAIRCRASRKICGR